MGELKNRIEYYEPEEYKGSTIRIVSLKSESGARIKIGCIGTIRDLMDAGIIVHSDAPSEDFWTFLTFGKEKNRAGDWRGPFLINKNGDHLRWMTGIVMESMEELQSGINSILAFML